MEDMFRSMILDLATLAPSYRGSDGTPHAPSVTYRRYRPLQIIRLDIKIPLTTSVNLLSKLGKNRSMNSESVTAVEALICF
ncbi:hypothetical protein HHK36_028951 [Tetracentron sinense]|uniref:Uncharacterized protein n=1 Tax=Tetracentron sinense TaxID=13715 RepID=A0A835D3X4_TETSI|nr:hypothetical protein HHK36_028951 [Tetracentron sinense]